MDQRSCGRDRLPQVRGVDPGCQGLEILVQPTEHRRSIDAQSSDACESSRPGRRPSELSGGRADIIIIIIIMMMIMIVSCWQWWSCIWCDNQDDNQNRIIVMVRLMIIMIMTNSENHPATNVCCYQLTIRYYSYALSSTLIVLRNPTMTAIILIIHISHHMSHDYIIMKLN